MAERKEFQDKEEEMIEAVMNIAEADAPKVKEGFDVMLDNILNKGMLPRDALGVQDSDTESLYAQGYHMYNIGKYKEARNIFGGLVIVNSLDPRFCFGHAACSHMLEDYEQAANMYNNQALLDSDDPVPYYHAADCYMKLGDQFSASVCLNLVIKRSGNNPKYKTMKERSEMTLKNLENEMKKAAEEMQAPETLEEPKKQNKEKAS